MARVTYLAGGVRRILFRWAPIPGTPQEDFFDNDTPEAKLWLSGGQGAGKTLTVSAKALKLSAINVDLPICWTVPDFGHVLDTILPTLTKKDPQTGEAWLLEEDQFEYHRGTHVLYWLGGGPIHFFSAKNWTSIKGPEMAGAVMDEPALFPFESWRATINRVRHPSARLRQTVMGGTPEGLGYLTDAFLEEERANYFIYNMDARLNVELIAAMPDYIKQLAENATEAELVSYLEGRPGALSGARAYQTFNRDDHWRTDVSEPMRDLPLRISFDFNVEPMASVGGQIVPGHHGKELLVQDAVIRNASWTPEVAEAWAEKYAGWPGGVIIYGDATGNNRSTTSKSSNYDLIREIMAPKFPSFRIHDSVLRKVNPSVTDRVNSVNVLFRNGLGHQRLLVRKTEPAKLCPTRELVRSLEQTLKKPGTSEIWKKPGETVSHAGDALGYLVAAEFPAKRPRIFGAESFGDQDI